MEKKGIDVKDHGKTEKAKSQLQKAKTMFKDMDLKAKMKGVGSKSKSNAAKFVEKVNGVGKVISKKRNEDREALLAQLAEHGYIV